MEKIGSWAFLIGVVLAVIFAVAPPQQWVGWALVLVGLVVGLVNVTEKEVTPFLMAGTVLVIVSGIGQGGNLLGRLPFVGSFLSNVLALFVPATIVVALKSVFTMAKRK